MLRTAAALAFMASALATAAPALAQGGPSPREARLEAARQHMRLACQPLEERGQYTRAFRCYSDVTAFLADPSIAEIGSRRPIRIASARVDQPVVPVAARPQRQGSGLLASNYVLLGVGF